MQNDSEDIFEKLKLHVGDRLQIEIPTHQLDQRYFTVVPFVILGVALKVLFALVFLPFKILGALLKGLVGIVGGLFGIVAGGVGLLFGLFVTLVVLVLLPLAPLLLLGGIVWLALKAFSPAARTA